MLSSGPLTAHVLETCVHWSVLFLFFLPHSSTPVQHYELPAASTVCIHNVSSEAVALPIGYSERHTIPLQGLFGKHYDGDRERVWRVEIF